MNLIILIGRISNEFNLKYLPGTGTPVGEFDIAVNRKSTSKENQKTDFFTIQVWGKYAEVLSEKLTKGRLVSVKGYVQIDKWKDENNNTCSKFKVISKDVKSLDYISSN